MAVRTGSTAVLGVWLSTWHFTVQIVFPLQVISINEKISSFSEFMQVCDVSVA